MSINTNQPVILGTQSYLIKKDYLNSQGLDINTYHEHNEKKKNLKIKPI